MKKFILITIIQILTLQLNAQTKLKGNKIVILQDREIEYFNKIIVKNDLKVFLLNGDTPKVTVETDENLQEYIVTRTENNVLEIYISQTISSSKKLNIYVTVADDLLDLELRDKADIFSENVIDCIDLNINTSGKSKLKFGCSATNVNINADDTSDVDLVISNADKTNVETDGNSNLN